MTALILLPRIVRYRDAPAYVGVDRNKFDAEWRPKLTEIPLGERAIGFDRHDLDALAEEFAALKIQIRRQPSSVKHRTQLYRHFDRSGRLLYVGVSLSVIARLAAHVRGSGWADQIARVEIEPFESRMEALRAERLAIVREEPLYNVVYARNR